MSILRHLGYDFVELSLKRDEIAQLSPDAEKTYLIAVEETGLPILSTSMGHFSRFTTLQPNERDGIIADIRAVINLNKSVGADTVLLATREDGPSVQEYRDIYRAALLPLADEAAEAGITLALEHVHDYKPYTLAGLVQAINHPAIGLYFDMGNCLHAGESPIEQARVCAPVTAQLHAKGGPTTPLASMPLTQVRHILESTSFQGRCCLEIPPKEGDRPLREAKGLLKMAGYCN